ncbi:hypothetical protein AUJ10_03735 [Candidatus Pacearchaeota archaeon CG1_02_31_27]|nr:MAG: hypothetical protein AUJ10_03735 [Candidatus Pacearchaeota archaeon CG1_02_31_27]
MVKVLFGPAGFGGSYDKGIPVIAKAGLDCVEVEFVYGVKMSNETAKKVSEFAEKNKINITSVHAPYYINLSSDESQKRGASRTRILQAAERAHYLKAKYVVFHAGYYGNLSKEETYKIIKEQIGKIQSEIKAKKFNVVLAPETTGKASQFGDLDELLKLKKETGCHLCVDFAHLKARYNGKRDYKEIFDKLRKNNVKEIHSHFSGINYTAKGERNHIITPEAEIKELLSWIKKYKIDTTIINESPEPIEDSVKSKKLWGIVS